MTAPARFRQSDLERAVKAMQRAGVREFRVNVDPVTGKMEFYVGQAANDGNEPEELE